MNQSNGTAWVKPIIQNSKWIIFFTMLLTAINTSNLIGFLIYFGTYQIASVFRTLMYFMVIPNPPKDNMATFASYDYLDISTLLTNGVIPNDSFLTLFMLTYTLAFVLFGIWKKGATHPQIWLGIIGGIYIIVYMLTLFMSIGVTNLMIYLEPILGYALGTLVCYIVSRTTPTALYFYTYQPRRKKLVCRAKTTNAVVVPVP
jgi:hypothetical protein